MNQDRLFVDQYENNTEPFFQSYVHGGRLLYAHKATEGIHHTDVAHKRRVERAHGYGLAVLHYHYCRPDQRAPAAEMAHFWDTVAPTWRRFDFLGLDFETGAPQESSQELSGYFMRCWQELKHLSGHTARSYGSTSFLAENVNRIWLRFKPRWQAQYGPDPGRSIWGTGWWAWQRTDGVQGPEPHSIAGIGTSDISVLNPATAIKLRALLWGRRRAARK